MPASVVAAEWDPDAERAVLNVTPLDGGEARAIQESDRHVFRGVAASPSGDRVAYVAIDRATRLYDLMVVPIEGGDARPVVQGLSEILGTPAWTPDGGTLALAVLEEGSREASVYTVPSGGGPLRELAAPEDYVFEPGFACSIESVSMYPHEWSPDGSTLLLGVSAPCQEVVFLQVAVVSVDGTGLRRLAAEGWRSESPDWSPDGQRVVFDSDGELFTVGIDGEGLESLGYGGQATWGPQGDIATVVTSNPSEPASYDLALRYAADLSTAEVVSDSSRRVTAPRWSPDGQSIVYFSEDASQTGLAVVDVAKRETRPLLGVGKVLDFTIAQEVPAPSFAPGSRYGGAERYETAALISQSTYPGLTKEEEEQGAELGCSAVMVSGEVYPDALSGSYLAGYLGRCFLLTAGDRLPEPTIAELDRLNTDTVTIVGGPAAVSPAVEQELRDRGIDVDRMFGEDRYETAFRVAATRDIGGPPAVFLVSGVDFPDALSSGAWAHNLAYPILLTTPERLHPQAEEALRQAQPGHVYVVGGPAAVSDEAMRQATMACSEAQQQRPCRTVERIAGGTRYSTAIAIADRFSRETPVAHVNLARGDSFPDALAGAPHSGEEGGATLFTVSRDELGAETEAWLREHADTIETVDVYGSDVVVSDEVWEQAKQAAD